MQPGAVHDRPVPAPGPVLGKRSEHAVTHQPDTTANPPEPIIGGAISPAIGPARQHLANGQFPLRLPAPCAQRTVARGPAAAA